MPFALNIAPSGDAPGEFQGRVVTELTLQYPNSPPVELVFTGDPSACEDPNAATCVQGVERLAVTSRIGGRFMKTGGDCAPNGLVGFEPDPQPWLVPDFVEGTEVDAETERRFRAECRASSAPLEPDTTGINVYTAAIPENWIKMPETVESDDLPSQPLDCGPLLHAWRVL